MTIIFYYYYNTIILNLRKVDEHRITLQYVANLDDQIKLDVFFRPRRVSFSENRF